MTVCPQCFGREYVLLIDEGCMPVRCGVCNGTGKVDANGRSDVPICDIYIKGTKEMNWGDICKECEHGPDRKACLKYNEQFFPRVACYFRDGLWQFVRKG